MAQRKDYEDLITSIVDRHKKRWDDDKAKMERLGALYDMRWWASCSLEESIPSTLDLLETDEGRNTVESVLAQIFVSEPGVVAQADPFDPDSNAEVVQALANNWCSSPKFVRALKQACRYALIYPRSALYLRNTKADGQEVKPGQAVEPCVLKPWEFFLDEEAATIDDLTYIGRVRHMTVQDAKDKFGNLRWGADEHQPYMSEDDLALPGVDQPDEYLTVCIYEFYDLRAGKLVWSAAPSSLDRKSRILAVDDIPLAADGHPASPIVPIVLGPKSDRPLAGSSLLERMEPSLVTKNWLLTVYRHRSKRAVNKTLVSPAVTEAALAKLTNGLMDEFVPVDSSHNLGSLLHQVPNNANPAEWRQAFDMVQEQIDKSINLPSFARGSATKATATEVLELQSYASSLIGLVAFSVNDAIRTCVKVYLAFLAVQLELSQQEDQPMPVMLVANQPTFLDPELVRARYRWTPVESIASPLGGTIERRNLLQVLPNMMGNPSVDQEALMEHIIRVFDLPADLMAQPDQAPMAEGEMPQSAPRTTEALLESTTPRKVLKNPREDF